MAGRPRTPTQILEDKGAYAKDPQRRQTRVNEPKGNGPVGAAPAYFDEAHQLIWDEIVDEAHPGVLTRADRKVLEIAVRLQRKMRLDTDRLANWVEFLSDALEKLGMDEESLEDMRLSFFAVMGSSTQDNALLVKCYSLMGMNPTDRSKVHGEPEKKESRFAGIAKTLGATSRPN